MPDIEQPCDLATQIHYRPAQGEWSALSQIAAGLGVPFRLPVPDAGYVDYYLEVTERQTGARLIFPEGGPESSLRYYVVAPAKEHQLEALPVGQGRAPDRRFRLLWGSAPGQAGLLPGNESSTIGPQALDVSESGEIYLLDQVNARVQVFDRIGLLTNVIPVEVGPLGDIGLAGDGTIFILDRVPGAPGTHPVVHKVTPGVPFGVPAGVESRPTLEWEPDLLDVVDDVPWVYGTPGDAWAPLFTEETNLSSGSLEVARPTVAGPVITMVSNLKRVDVAPLAPEGPRRFTLRAASDRNIGEIALFEPDGNGGYWLVLRTWQEFPEMWDQHEVVHLGADGTVTDHFAVDNGEYAETAALSQFRIGRDGRLYQIFSDETGLEIRSFDLK